MSQYCSEATVPVITPQAGVGRQILWQVVSANLLIPRAGEDVRRCSQVQPLRRPATGQRRDRALAGPTGRPDGQLHALAPPRLRPAQGEWPVGRGQAARSAPPAADRRPLGGVQVRATAAATTTRPALPYPVRTAPTEPTLVQPAPGPTQPVQRPRARPSRRCTSRSLRPLATSQPWFDDRFFLHSQNVCSRTAIVTAALQCSSQNTCSVHMF
jgi:hypothetical protein